MESLFSKSPSEDYMQMICTVYCQSRYRSFSSKIIPSYNPYLANFSLLVVKIPKLLAKWVKCPFSYGEIDITVCERGGIMLILLCPLEKDPLNWAYHSVPTSLSIWWAVLEYYDISLIKHQRNFISLTDMII